MNFHVYLVFSMKILKSSNVANYPAGDVITVNIFFAHWIKKNLILKDMVTISLFYL